MLPSNSGGTQAAQFASERIRLLSVLGELTEGGIVEDIRHIGATSLPGSFTSSCIDIALSVWPFPIAAEGQAALAAAGYEQIPANDGPAIQHFRHVAGTFQLFVMGSGSDLWTDYLVLQGYLCDDEAARHTYLVQNKRWADKATSPATYQAIKAEWFCETLDAARAWWIRYYGFEPLWAIAAELREFRAPWYIASGWALDLFLGRVSRVHHDVDIAIPRANQLDLQQYLAQRGWKFVTPLEGKLERWPAHMRLVLPRHQVHAHRGSEFIDVLLTDIEYGVWRYRRAPVIIRTAERMSLSTAEDVRFLAPEIVLLFKSKNTGTRERRQDQLDFEAVYEQLEPERRAWLRWALLAADPNHAWVERLR